MKKLLLVKPHYYHIPIGFAYVLATLEKHGFSYDFFDLALTKLNLNRELAAGKYYAAATGGLVSDYRFFHEFIKACKKTAPELPVILGGNITNCLSDDLLFHRLGADYAIQGEAETALPALLRHLQSSPQPPKGLPGTAFLDPESGETIRSRPIPLDLQANDPRPAWKLINHEFYIGNSKHHAFAPGKTFLPILTGRGCSGRCSFCNPTLGRFRPRRVECILDEMREAATQYSFDVFNFATEVFFARQEDILEFCARYKEQGFSKHWFCSLRIDVGPEALEAMKDAGCVGVSIGFESASDTILKRMRKGITSEQGRAFVGIAKKLGLPLECNIMVGNEGETLEDLRASFSMMRRERVDANVNLTVAYNGTAIFRRAVERGDVASEHEKALGERYPGLYSPEMSESRYLNISAFPSLGRLHQAAMREYRALTGELMPRYASQPVLRLYGGAPRLLWKCRVCGEENDMNATWRQFDGLVRRRFCGRCWNFSYISILPENVRRAVAKKLARYSRVAISGDGHNTTSLWAYPLEGLDMDGIVAVAAKTAPSRGDEFFFLPRLPLTEALTLMPDALLCLDRELGYTPKPSPAFRRGWPEIIRLTPHLFPEGMWRGRRILFLGGYDDQILPREYLEDAQVVGVVGGQGKAEGVGLAAPNLPVNALFSDGWDAAVLNPAIEDGAGGENVLRWAVYAAILWGARPVLRPTFDASEYVAWIPWRRKDILARLAERAADKVKQGLALA